MYRPGLFLLKRRWGATSKMTEPAPRGDWSKLLALADGDARALAATATAVVVHEEAAAHQHDDEKRTNDDAEGAAATVVSHSQLHRLQVDNDEYRANNSEHGSSVPRLKREHRSPWRGTSLTQARLVVGHTSCEAPMATPRKNDKVRNELPPQQQAELNPKQLPKDLRDPDPTPDQHDQKG
jgi:hypothetical protein